MDSHGERKAAGCTGWAILACYTLAWIGLGMVVGWWLAEGFLR